MKRRKTITVSTRLTEVFQSAQEIPFDDKSRLVFFSDCHRGDNSWTDRFAKNQSLFFYALERYFKEGFTYFELGDGDELYEDSHFSDIRYAHSHIFWRLREFYRAGRFHMIYGNHDKERADPKVVAQTLFTYIDDRTGQKEPLFEGIRVHEGLVLKHSPTGGKIFLVHGYQGDMINDQFWKFDRFLIRTLWRPLELLGVDDPTSPAKNFRKRDALERKIEEWIKEKNQPTIFGHTHRPSFATEGEPPYFNDGSCVDPRCITGIEIDKGKIELIKWSVTTDEDGYLMVGKDILAGPRKVASLFG
ncbi:MAG: metallophosphoesterase [Anaerolineales bacterium]